MESGKNISKDEQIVAGVLEDLGITEYEDGVLPLMLKFINKYVKNVIEDALEFSNHTNNKETIDANDIARALSHHTKYERNWIRTPDKEQLLSMVKRKNSIPLPQIKSSTVSQLPPDHYSQTACNDSVKSREKKAPKIFRFSALPKNSVQVSGPIATSNKPSPITSITSEVNSNPIVTKPNNNSQ
ncbi:transcription initiation factor TFIID subunit 9 [Trichonephila clavipes]|uniref:Transcription initiation factor TFIID subunit 9 n=1 Tax=Trichonephila clavipes TaxID=2585209 RepID=A0A8X6S0U5_TRICX|nr:transcription initiation factor TFIID subunit 9 [Trichonephila clavipes]